MMTLKKRRPCGVLSALLLTWLDLLSASSARSQTKELSPADLIRFLTYQSDRPDKYGIAHGIFSCGTARAEDEENRTVADALVKLGHSAVPEIEQAFDSIEEHGRQSPFAFNSDWLLEAYARIRGAAGYPRLHRLQGNPKLTFLQWGLDQSIALSLHLTSFVSGSGLLAEKFTCGRGFPPTDILDQLILAWERNDQQWVEASLGPNAKAALQSLLNGRTWAKMRAQLWRGKSGGSVAVGYRFEDSGWWSEREQPLQINLDARKPANPEPETLFTNSLGGECGRHRVKFQADEGNPTIYRVDNPDLGDLLHVISSCAGRSNEESSAGNDSLYATPWASCCPKTTRTES